MEATLVGYPGASIGGFCVRFFFPPPFFFDRITLIGSGGLGCITSAGMSYSGKDDNRGGVGLLLSAGVCCRDTSTEVCGPIMTPSGISPSRSTTNGSAEELRDVGRREGSLGSEISARKNNMDIACQYVTCRAKHPC